MHSGSPGVYSWEETSVSLYLPSLGSFDIVHSCQFSICLILLLLFVAVPSCPILVTSLRARLFLFCTFISQKTYRCMWQKEEGPIHVDKWINEHWIKEQCWFWDSKRPNTSITEEWIQRKTSLQRCHPLDRETCENRILSHLQDSHKEKQSHILGQSRQLDWVKFPVKLAVLSYHLPEQSLYLMKKTLQDVLTKPFSQSSCWLESLPSLPSAEINDP